MNKKILVGLIAATSCAMNAQAMPGFDIFVGAQAWSSSPSGDATSTAKIEGESSANTRVWAAFEHPVPMVPNILAAVQATKSDTETTVGTTTIKGELDTGYADLTAYWQLPIPMLTLNLGVTARMNAGEVITAGAGATPKDIDSTLTMLYGKAEFKLPIVGFGVGAELNTGSGGEDKTTDASIYALYETTIGLGVTGGFRSIQTDNDESSSSIKTDGAFASVYFHF